jgi:hypothetical protein
VGLIETRKQIQLVSDRIIIHKSHPGNCTPVSRLESVVSTKTRRNPRMAWRSSFGATVLLALVALHASTAMPTVYDMLREMSRSGKIGDLSTEIETNAPNSLRGMLDFWLRERESRCRDSFFEHVGKWYRLTFFRNSIILNSSTCTKVWDIIQNWEETCYSRLEKKIQSELAAMSASTREQFKLFAEQDQRECESNGVCSSFYGKISLIGILRQSIGSPRKTDADELKAAEGFVSACKEMAASESIANTRTEYKARTPSSPEPHFPHIRFYDYCIRLLNLDLPVQTIDEQSQRADMAVRFSENLAEIQKNSRANSRRPLRETAERERSVAEAAVQIVRWNHIRQAVDTKLVLEIGLSRLRYECSYLLDQVDNMIWMHRHMYDLLDQTPKSQGTAYAKRNLMYSKACRQLEELDNEKIIKMVTEEPKPRSLFSDIKFHLGINRT